MIFCDRAHVSRILTGKRVAVVGSGPGVLGNKPGFIDSHDVVVRVNNYKLSEPTGFRTDVFYSFFGLSIRKTSETLKRDGVVLCMSKCPDSKPITSEWHEKQGKFRGTDFRPIYREREHWWFCPTYVPDEAEFLHKFYMLGGHIPTTGFAAIFDVLAFAPESLYLTGFDFFMTGVHNVNEPWNKMNHSDPIGHRPNMERDWIKEHMREYPITCDPMMTKALAGELPDMARRLVPRPIRRRFSMRVKA